MKKHILNLKLHTLLCVCWTTCEQNKHVQYVNHVQWLLWGDLFTHGESQSWQNTKYNFKLTLEVLLTNINIYKMMTMTMLRCPNGRRMTCHTLTINKPMTLSTLWARVPKQHFDFNMARLSKAKPYRAKRCWGSPLPNVITVRLVW